MNIFYCGKLKRSFRTGGEFLIYEIFGYLSKKGCSIDEFNEQDLSRLKDDGDYLKKNLFLYKKLRSIPPNTIVIQNILHLDYLKYFFANILIRYKRKDVKSLLFVQQIYHFNLSIIKKIINRIAIYLYLQFFDKIVTTSQFLKKELVRLGATRNKIIIVGAAGQTFNKKKIYKKENRSGVKLLCVGHIREIKGQIILIQALNYLKDLDWDITLVGDASPSDIYYKKELNEEIKRSNQSDRVFWAGRLEGERLAEAYAASNIVVVPSLYEGYGLVIREAMSSGIPVVASNVGGIPEILINGVNGFLVPAADPVALADALRMIILDPKLRSQMGALGRKHEATLPTLHQVCEQFSQAIVDLSQK